MATKTITVRLEAAVASYQAGMARATASTKAFGTSTLQAASQNKQSFTTLGLAAVALGGALAFGLKRAADAALEFQDKLVRIQTLVGLSKDEVDDLGQSVINLASTVGIGPTELADALYFVTSSGFAGAEALKVVEASAKAAAIGLGETGTIADAVTSVMNAYGHQTYTAAQVTDILAEAVNQGKLEADELAPVLGNIVPIASALGISFEDVAGTMAVLSLRGTDAAEGATQISGILSSLLQTSPQVVEALSSVGLSMQDLRDVAGESGLFGVMKLLNRAFHGNVEELRQIFPNIRAFRGVMSALSGDVSQTKMVLDSVADSTGTVDEAFKDWGDSAVAAKAKFSASFEAMAVVVGSVFLPILSRVFDAFRGFADFIVGLPGPVRAIAIGLVAVSAAIALIGGAALLAMPRIVQMKFALDAMSGTKIGSAVRGFAGFLAGPWGIALGLATVGLGIWAAKQEEARQRVEELTNAIEADSGALGINTKELVANRLEQDGVLEAAGGLGIALEDVVDAALGSESAHRRVTAALAAQGLQWDNVAINAGRGGAAMSYNASQANKVTGAIDGMNGELGEAKSTAEREAEATGDSADAHIRLNDITDRTAEVMKGMQAALDATKESADALTLALQVLAGAQIDERKAAIGFANSLADMRKELRKGTKSLDTNTQAGRDNQEAILSAVDAAIEHGAAVAEESGSVEKGARVVRKHIAALIDEAVEAGVSRRAIERYIEKLNLTPEQIKTQIALLGVDASQTAIDRINTGLDSIDGRVVTWTVKGLNAGGLPGAGVPTDHAGGVVGTTRARRMHGGGGVGSLRSDERLIIAQLGEGIISRSQMRALTSAQRSEAQVIVVREDRPLKVTVRADRRRFMEELDRDFTYAGRWAS